MFLNRCYWPDSEATGQLLTDLCESLSDCFDVHVVCGQPNSASTDEYVRKGVESRNGVTIHRLTHTRFAKALPAGRLLNLLSFACSAGCYLRRSKLPAEVVISETDPFLLPIVAAKHSHRVGSKLVCYLQDIYPDVAVAIGKVRDGWFTGRIRSRLRQAYQTADRVIVLGQCMRDRLAAPPWSLDVKTLGVIPNWADCQAIQPLSTQDSELRRREGLSDAFVVMHSGNMGLTQRLDVLVDATRSKHWPSHAILLLVGDGAARAQLQAKTSNRTQRVRFLPYQPRQELDVSLSAADLHVVSMHERTAGCLCPSKLYGILAAGRPVLAVASENSDLFRIVAQQGLGWSCPPGDADGIAKAVAAAASNDDRRAAAGNRARLLACSQYDRPVASAQFKSMLTELLDRRTGLLSTRSLEPVNFHS